MKKETIIGFALGIIGVALLICAFIFTGIPKDIGASTQYDCDVKNLHLSTTININKNGDSIYTVKGNVFRFVTDPLTLYKGGQKVAFADDTYHLISQDSHTIFHGNNRIEMVGKVNLFGNTYDIYNSNKMLIAKAEFNATNTHGSVYDANNNLIADYTSNLFFNDYIVQIKDTCPLTDEQVLMICASYYSDQNYDAQTSSNSSNDD